MIRTQTQPTHEVFSWREATHVVPISLRTVSPVNSEIPSITVNIDPRHAEEQRSRVEGHRVGALLLAHLAVKTSPPLLSANVRRQASIWASGGGKTRTSAALA